MITNKFNKIYKITNKFNKIYKITNKRYNNVKDV